MVCGRASSHNTGLTSAGQRLQQTQDGGIRKEQAHRITQPAHTNLMIDGLSNLNISCGENLGEAANRHMRPSLQIRRRRKGNSKTLSIGTVTLSSTHQQDSAVGIGARTPNKMTPLAPRNQNDRKHGFFFFINSPFSEDPVTSAAAGMSCSESMESQICSALCQSCPWTQSTREANQAPVRTFCWEEGGLLIIPSACQHTKNHHFAERKDAWSRKVGSRASIFFPRGGSPPARNFDSIWRVRRAHHRPN